MIRLDRKHLQPVADIDAELRLDYDARCRPSQQLALEHGQVAWIGLAAGSVLADGDVLTNAEQNVFVRVLAAPEALSVVHCADQWLINRLCYQLGLRGVALQISCQAVAYRRDKTLDALVVAQGLKPVLCCCAFHPEIDTPEQSEAAAVNTATIDQPRAQANG